MMHATQGFFLVPSGREPSHLSFSRRAMIRTSLGLGGALAFWRPLPADAATRGGWRFCTKCRGLFFPGGTLQRKKRKKGKKKSGSDGLGVCPAGGKHAPRADLAYVLHLAISLETNPQLYKNFQQCTKCRGLFSRDIDEKGLCPAAGAHASGDAPDAFFALWAGDSIPGMDDAWDECAKCRSLFNYAGGGVGSCPAGGGHLRVNVRRYTLFVLS